MNNRTLKLVTIALLPLGVAAFAGCHSEPKPNEEVIKTATGEEVIDTYSIDATVTAIDSAKRRVTISDAKGKRSTFKAKPDQDISQLQVGDRIQATLTEELAISLEKNDKAAPSASVTDVAAGAAGSADAVVLAGDQVQLTTKVTNIDAKKHKVTLEMPDGTSKTVKTGKGVNLANVSVGDDVIVRMTEALAIDFQEK